MLTVSNTSNVLETWDVAISNSSKIRNGRICKKLKKFRMNPAFWARQNLKPPGLCQCQRTQRYRKGVIRMPINRNAEGNIGKKKNKCVN